MKKIVLIVVVVLGLMNFISYSNRNTPLKDKNSKHLPVLKKNDYPSKMSFLQINLRGVDFNPLFKITIERKLSQENCTQGYISVNGNVIGYTLEKPDQNNKNYIASIPKGTYSAFIRIDGGETGTKGWRIELEDVPNRTNVQIHVGNYTSESTGCILIGKSVDLKNCAVFGNLINDLQASFNKFTTDLILNQQNTKPIQIEVEISGI